MQNILVIATLCVAVMYLLRQFYLRFLKKGSKCDSCAFGKEMDVRIKR